MAWSKTPWAAWNGLGFGLVAGAVFAVAECLASLVGGQGLMAPVRYAASVLLGVRALTEGPLGLMLAAGLAVHFGLSALFGLAYALIDARLSPELRPKVSHQTAVGMLFALGVWGVTFQFVARGYYPWFLENTPQFFQLLLHALFFGAPLGLLFAAAERRRVAIALFEQAAQQEHSSEGRRGT
ncbi:hypothetical protein [Hyalangium minutum]|uniref:Uncharacterized protein n=1 Tax=Hyalangium minutum TaxID=394096 RepID=A0A085WLN1_9BACT|nr:hypothetical protein [Hyalangium minutum]KFE68594.1 hypothetical protein DB31_7831 [Hyalangium minutum]